MNLLRGAAVNTLDLPTVTAVCRLSRALRRIIPPRRTRAHRPRTKLASTRSSSMACVPRTWAPASIARVSPSGQVTTALNLPCAALVYRGQCAPPWPFTTPGKTSMPWWQHLPSAGDGLQDPTWHGLPLCHTSSTSTCLCKAYRAPTQEPSAKRVLTPPGW